MGVDPDLDDDVGIVNGGFDPDVGWLKDDNWEIAGGEAQFVQDVPSDNFISQLPGFNEGFRYRVTFTLSNYNIDIGAGKGFRVEVGGVTSGFFTANGTYTFEVVAADDSGFLGFFVTGASNGNSVDLDDILLLKLMNYADDVLDIVIIEPRFSTIEVAVASDYWNRLNAKPDNTNVHIAFDLV